MILEVSSFSRRGSLVAPHHQQKILQHAPSATVDVFTVNKTNRSSKLMLWKQTFLIACHDFHCCRNTLTVPQSTATFIALSGFSALETAKQQEVRKTPPRSTNDISYSLGSDVAVAGRNPWLQVEVVT